MQYKAALVALAGAALAQDSPSICDKYTTALLKENTPANQLTVLTLVVNTAVIGNYSNMSMSAVTGILNPGEYMGEQVNLLGYFDGTMMTTNRNNMPASVSFLDGGGATPLTMNMPANDTTSNQHMLLTHLYSFFGVLLGCSGVGMDGFPAYGGNPSQYDVHKFMDISANEFGYFVSQVGASAKSFGVTDDDVTTAANALMQTFGYKCIPAAALGGGQPQLQSICIGDGCETAPDSADCAAYPSMGAGVAPSGSMSGSPSMTSSMSTPVDTNAASHHHMAMEGMLGAACAALAFL